MDLKFDLVVITSDEKIGLAEQILTLNLQKLHFVASSFLVTEKTVMENRCFFENYGKVTFSEKLKYGISLADSEYILLMLDDFVILNIYHLNMLSDVLRKISPDYVRLTAKPSNGTPIITKYPFVVTSPSQLYQLSTQPSLWRRDVLSKIVDEEINPWNFEAFYHLRYIKILGCTLGVKSDILKCIEVVKKGRIKRSVAYQLGLSYEGIPVMGVWEDLQSIVKVWLNKLFFSLRFYR
jgi:hypothetical protein